MQIEGTLNSPLTSNITEIALQQKNEETKQNILNPQDTVSISREGFNLANEVLPSNATTVANKTEEKAVNDSPIMKELAKLTEKSSKIEERESDLSMQTEEALDAIGYGGRGGMSVDALKEELEKIDKQIEELKKQIEGLQSSGSSDSSEEAIKGLQKQIQVLTNQKTVILNEII